MSFVRTGYRARRRGLVLMFHLVRRGLRVGFVALVTVAALAPASWATALKISKFTPTSGTGETNSWRLRT